MHRLTKAQELSVNATGTLLVSAVAGAGKTSTLTERIIHKILNGGDIGRMLVVTFTRAATAELRSKISEALSKALAERPNNRHLSRQMMQIASADIKTIDSFCINIVREHFERFGLSASFQTIADDSPVIASIASRWMTQTIHNFYETNRRPDGSNAFAELIDCVLPQRSDNSADKTLVEFYNQLRTYRLGIRLPERSADEYFAYLNGDRNVAFWKAIVNRLTSIVIPYRDACVNLLAYCEQHPKFAEKYTEDFTREVRTCDAWLEAFPKGYREAYEAFAANGIQGTTKRVPTGWKDDEGPALLAEAKRLKPAGNELSVYFSKTPECFEAELKKTEPLCRLLGQFLQAFETNFSEEKIRHGYCTFTDCTRNMLSMVVDENGTPTNFAQCIGERYDEVYIDEYQDVNEIQDLIFSAIGGDHRYMVGDIKQCIYAFRGADPLLFADYKRRFHACSTEADFVGDNGNCITMAENFRCEEPIVEFTNTVSSLLFSACENSVRYRPEDDLRHAKDSAVTPAEPVTVAVFSAPQKEDDGDDDENARQENSELHAEDIWVANEIAALLQNGTRLLHKADADKEGQVPVPVRPRDIAVLATKNAHLTGIEAALCRLHVPVCTAAPVRSELLGRLWNLLCAIDNPTVDTAVSEALMTDWFGFSASDLAIARKAEKQSASLYRCIETLADSETVGLLANKCRTAVAFFREVRPTARALSVDQFLRTLYRHPLLVCDAGTDEFRCVYDAARSCRKTFTGLSSFLSLYREKRPTVPKLEQDAVQLTTVHKSKGLQYPFVFLVGCGKQFRGGKSTENLAYDPAVGVSLMLTDSERLTRSSSVLHSIAQSEAENREIEERIRLLYVACTRAAERLYLTGTMERRITYESIEKKAKTVIRGNRNSILSCRRYLHWISAALLQVDAEHRDRFCRQLKVQDTQNELSAFRYRDSDTAMLAERTYAEYISPAVEQTEHGTELMLLPAKVAASKVSIDFADRLLKDGGEDSEEAIRAHIDALRAHPSSFASLLEEGNVPTAAQRGTAAHEFLQFCDFQRLKTVGTDAEFDRLEEQKYITHRTRDIADRDALERFLASDLYALISNAASVEREVQFSLFLPYAEFSQDCAVQQMLGNRVLHVQGSIDLLIRTSDGRLLLVDYKTDRVPDAAASDEASLVAFFGERHRRQLHIYRRAVETLYGRLPDATYIYSIMMGRTVEIPFAT